MMQKIKNSIYGIIARIIVLVLAWYSFAFASTWLIMVGGDDMAGAIWYPVVCFLMYPYVGLWLLIEIVLAVKKVLQSRIWQVFGLYFILQIFCSPFVAMQLMHWGRN
jgi:hypothetical protein